ncbi:MAG: flagellar hook-basal body complex protein [Firmicutes bacterium]|nr:flagellar hook-basal body complex protein [Bacillota bacterium]
MFRGIYTTLSGMGVQQAKLNVTTNNLANVESKGYKREQVIAKSFQQVMIGMQSPFTEGVKPVGASHMGTAVSQVNIDMHQGDLVKTDRYTDIAINGEGFFVMQVDSEDGERESYSRDCSFYLDNDGYLVNSRGDKLLGESGPIEVGSEEFLVKQDGTVLVDNNEIDKIRLVEFEDTKYLEKEGEKYFSATDDAVIKSEMDSTVNQGFIEKSNVDVTTEMTKIIQVMRQYQAGQKIIQAYDQLLDKAVNQVGTLR